MTLDNFLASLIHVHAFSYNNTVLKIPQIFWLIHFPRDIAIFHKPITLNHTIKP